LDDGVVFLDDNVVVFTEGVESGAPNGAGCGCGCTGVGASAGTGSHGSLVLQVFFATNGLFLVPQRVAILVDRVQVHRPLLVHKLASWA